MLSPASRSDLALLIGFSNRALLRIGLSMACGFWVAMVAYLLLKLPRGYGLQVCAAGVGVGVGVGVGAGRH